MDGFDASLLRTNCQGPAIEMTARFLHLPPTTYADFSALGHWLETDPRLDRKQAQNECSIPFTRFKRAFEITLRIAIVRDTHLGQKALREGS
jgi:hypothetical protein